MPLTIEQFRDRHVRLHHETQRVPTRYDTFENVHDPALCQLCALIAVADAGLRVNTVAKEHMEAWYEPQTDGDIDGLDHACFRDLNTAAARFDLGCWICGMTGGNHKLSCQNREDQQHRRDLDLMTDTLETEEAFDQAITLFLTEHAADTDITTNWRVDNEDNERQEWIVGLWAEDQYKGRFLITPTSCELIEEPGAEA